MGRRLVIFLSTEARMSQKTLAISDEESSELDWLLQRELGTIQVDLDHIRTQTYRDKLLHHRDVIRCILEKVEASNPVAPVN
jgi:hypothetical protein